MANVERKVLPNADLTTKLKEPRDGNNSETPEIQQTPENLRDDRGDVMLEQPLLLWANTQATSNFLPHKLNENDQVRSESANPNGFVDVQEICKILGISVPRWLQIKGKYPMDWVRRSRSPRKFYKLEDIEAIKIARQQEKKERLEISREKRETKLNELREEKQKRVQSPEGYISARDFFKTLGVTRQRWHQIKSRYTLAILRVGTKVYFPEKEVLEMARFRQTKDGRERVVSQEPKRQVPTGLNTENKSGIERKPKSKRRQIDNTPKNLDGARDGQGSVSSHELYMREVRNTGIQIEKHRKWSAQVFAGQLATQTLTNLAKSGLLTQAQKEEVSEILSRPKISYLREQFILAWLQDVRRVKKPNMHWSTTKFLLSRDNLSIWFVKKFAKLLSIEDDETRGIAINSLIQCQTKKIEGGLKAHNDFVAANLRLVSKVAFRRIYKGTLDTEDLESFGYLGLMIAASRFNFLMGTRFSTYAINWIKQAVNQGVYDLGRVIRLPIHINEQLVKLMRNDSEFIQSYGELQDLEVLASKSDPQGKLVQAVRAGHVVSINMKVGNREDTELGELIVDDGFNIEEFAEREILRQKVREAIATLAPREQFVINHRYGFEDGRSKSLELVGRELGVTRERARQIEAQALNKLRYGSRAREIRPFADL